MSRCEIVKIHWLPRRRCVHPCSRVESWETVMRWRMVVWMMGMRCTVTPNRSGNNTSKHRRNISRRVTDCLSLRFWISCSAKCRHPCNPLHCLSQHLVRRTRRVRWSWWPVGSGTVTSNPGIAKITRMTTSGSTGSLQDNFQGVWTIISGRDHFLMVWRKFPAMALWAASGWSERCQRACIRFPINQGRMSLAFHIWLFCGRAVVRRLSWAGYCSCWSKFTACLDEFGGRADKTLGKRGYVMCANFLCGRCGERHWHLGAQRRGSGRTLCPPRFHSMVVPWRTVWSQSTDVDIAFRRMDMVKLRLAGCRKFLLYDIMLMVMVFAEFWSIIVKEERTDSLQNIASASLRLLILRMRWPRVRHAMYFTSPHGSPE